MARAIGVLMPCAAAMLVLLAGDARAQGPGADSLMSVYSLGLPHAFRAYGALGAGVAEHGAGAGLLTQATLGITRDITNPTPGFLGVALEAWVGTRGRRLDGGARLLAGLPAARLYGGFDYAARVHRADFVLSAGFSVHRGGFPLPGATIRVDWVPARTQLLGSLSVPFGQHAGRTRPGVIEVSPPATPPYRPPPPPGDVGLDLLVARLRERARWIAKLTLVPLPGGAPERSRPVVAALTAHLAERNSANQAGAHGPGEDAAYHELVVRIFARALGEDSATAVPSGLARAVADTARRVFLDELLIPYDRDLGRIRRPAVLTALRHRAAATFGRWAGASALVPPATRAGVEAAFAALLTVAQETADSARSAWGDSRLIWLPLQLGLRSDQHDTQTELDALIERIIGRRFLPGHDLDYATDEHFEPAVIRSVLDARDYHVLWIHDFAGRSPAGRPDTVAERLVLEGYIAALERAALAYDRTGKVPTFLILLDRYYYRRSVGDRWLELLSDPLGMHFRLRGRWHATEARVHAAQARLRAAVAASPALRSAERRHGRRWLRRLLSVHVSVTNPPDPTFGGPALVGNPSPVPDDIMRDHRKIAFADIDENNPTRGVAILTGLGIGESYARYRWLDRTIVLRGPAAAALKEEARDLLRSQGFRENQIPTELLPRAEVTGRSRATPPEWWARVVIAMNETGYGRKSASAGKAALYTLLPPGSTIIASDPQWLSRFWGGMLLGSALRGSKVLVIGPGPENAPFGNAFVQRVLQRELFLRLLEARAALQVPLAASGGRIDLGLFRIGLGTYNVAGGVRAIRDGLRQHPFLRDVLPFHPSVWTFFDQADSLLFSLGEVAADTNANYHPAFHLKTQFMGTATAMRAAVGRPEWRTFFERRLRERLHESPAGTDITLGALAPLRPYLESRSADAREAQGLYLLVGSHNQDDRSLLLDGEALCLVAGEAALVSAGDMLLLSTVGVEWLDGPEEIDATFPAWDDIHTEVARGLEHVF